MYTSLFDCSDFLSAKTCQRFSIIQKIRGFPKTLYLLVYFIRFMNEFIAKSNTIQYVHCYLQNHPAHSKFNIAEILDKEGQCSLAFVI
jgi:hypothetical protein